MSAFTDGRFLAISVFLGFLAACLFLSLLSSPDLHEGGDDFFAEQGSRRPLRQGLALTGDFVSAAGVLHLCGLVADVGYDGFLVLTATALAPLLLKVWLAERLPDGPGWSLGDVLGRRLPALPARRAAGFATLLVCVPLLTAQLVPVGHITAAFLGMPHGYGVTTGIALAGVLICACAAIGGARCSTRLQLVKAVGFFALAAALAATVLAAHGWDLSALRHAAAHSGPHGDPVAHTVAYLDPGRLFGPDLLGRLDTVGLAVTFLLGAAFLPHLVMRLATSRTSENARRATSWTVVLSGLLLAAVAVIGYGVQAAVGTDGLHEAGPHGGDLLMLAAFFGDHDSANFACPVLATFVACAAFFAVLASASVLLLAGAAAVVHDLEATCPTYATGTTGAAREHTAREHTPDEPRRRPVHARTALVAVGATSIALGVLSDSAGVAFWLALAFTLAATAVLPALVCALLWPGFTRRGLTWSVYGGTSLALTLFAFSPSVSGSPDALFPGTDWALFPLHTPTLLSVPAAFVLAWAGSVRDRTPDPAPAPDPAPDHAPGPDSDPAPAPRSA